MTPAIPSDRDQITAFLAAHAERAMFPLNNLTHHGMGSDHPFGVTMWLTRQKGAITDVLTLSNSGMVMPCLPTGDYIAAARALQGRLAEGIVGPRAMARGLELATGLAPAAKSLDHDEPHFLLDLAKLTVPPGPGQIVPLSDAPEPIIKAWMLDYQLATLGTPPDRAPGRVQASYDTYTTNRSHVVLMDQGTPLAMTGFNAQLPDIVQVGGVYTPPALRGRGHARRALALHLAERRAMGASRATLFSASDMAARAYRAIGFHQIGDWSLILFTHKEMVP